MHHRKDRELLITGDWLAAKESQTYGFVSQVVEDDKLEEATARMAQRIAQRSLMV
ncbi:MAG: hypothetical protein HOC20_11195 [Chloroflexi bacterium]|nr:hypothetical protein [Chloroflexota bacterium]